MTRRHPIIRQTITGFILGIRQTTGIFALLALLLPAPLHAQESISSIVVLADGNLSLPLARLVREYAKQKQVSVGLSLTDTSEISSQIAEGGNVDVLITARTGWLEQLKLQGLIDIYSETPVARDRLALVGPPENRLQVSLEEGFPAGKLLLAMGSNRLFVVSNPQYRLDGGYAREAMRRMGADFDMEPYTVYVDSRQELQQLIMEEKAYGLMLATEAQQYGIPQLDLVPEDTHLPISYRAVVLAGSNMDQARRFVDYLKSQKSRAIFREAGFMLD